MNSFYTNVFVQNEICFSGAPCAGSKTIVSLARSARPVQNRAPRAKRIVSRALVLCKTRINHSRLRSRLRSHRRSRLRSRELMRPSGCSHGATVRVHAAHTTGLASRLRFRCRLRWRLRSRLSSRCWEPRRHCSGSRLQTLLRRSAQVAPLGLVTGFRR